LELESIAVEGAELIKEAIKLNAEVAEVISTILGIPQPSSDLISIVLKVGS
jgi:hypothetical protein